MSMGHALLGAVLGVGLGEAVDAINGDGYGRVSRGRMPKNGLTNPVGVGSNLEYVDQLLDPNAAAPARRLPPVDNIGAPLDSVPETQNAGDLNFQLPELGAGMEMNPDKFDTVTGDALQTQRRARVFRAVSDASRINEILGQRSISRQQAASLIRDYHQKYPDINIPIQPYTAEQAKELRNRVLLAQKQDEAESQGFDRGTYTADPNTGLPVLNPLFIQKRIMEKEREIQESKNKHELRLAQLAAKKDEVSARKDALKTADQALKIQDELLGKEPDPFDASEEEIKKWKEEKKAIADARIRLLRGGSEGEPQAQAAPKGSGMGEQIAATITGKGQKAFEKDLNSLKVNAEGLAIIEDDDDKELLAPNQVFFDARNGRKYRWQEVPKITPDALLEEDQAPAIASLPVPPLTAELDSRLNRIR